MKFFQKMGLPYLILLIICGIIIMVSEYLFLTGDKLHGIFIVLWAPMIVGLMILFKLIDNEH